MVSEPDHAHSGPPNTDTEEEADPDKEPRRRSARTAAKVRVLDPVQVPDPRLTLLNPQVRIKQQARKSKNTRG